MKVLLIVLMISFSTVAYGGSSKSGSFYNGKHVQMALKGDRITGTNLHGYVLAVIDLGNYCWTGIKGGEFVDEVFEYAEKNTYTQHPKFPFLRTIREALRKYECDNRDHLY